MPGFNIPAESCLDENAFKESSAYTGPGHLSETARKHRYLLEVFEPMEGKGADSNLLMYLEKCTRPTPEIDEIVIHNGQDEIYRPGKNKWNPLEFTFYEKLSGSEPGSFRNAAAENLYNWWAKSMIILSDSKQGKPQDYYKNAYLQLLDGVGNPVWTYKIYDCWPQKITPAQMSYSESEISTIVVTLRFNKAEEV
jgi:hypothetical protein